MLYVTYLLLYYSFDKHISDKNDELAKKLTNEKIQALLNGSGINNIPNLTIVSTNPAIETANACAKGPVYIGRYGSDDDCKRTCANSTAKVINVEDDETVVHESAVLQAGAHCTIGPRPQCNMKTSYAMMTINSVTCRSKFPEIFGGEFGNTIVACNNKKIRDPQNYLWDNKYLQKVDPYTTVMSDPDELFEGKYRFECIFKGLDVQNNQYMQSPLNRFHPIRNYCASEIYAAWKTVKTIFKNDGSYECDCGDKATTRVSHLFPGDMTSLCSNVTNSIDESKRIKEREIINVAIPCFTKYSPLEYVATRFPCQNEQFTRKGSQLMNVTVPFSSNLQSLIEHPLYKDLKTEEGVGLPLNSMVP